MYARTHFKAELHASIRVVKPPRDTEKNHGSDGFVAEMAVFIVRG